MALHLPTGPLKTHSGLKPVPRCEPSTYQLIIDDLATVPSGLVSYNKNYPGLFFQRTNAPLA